MPLDPQTAQMLAAMYGLPPGTFTGTMGDAGFSGSPQDPQINRVRAHGSDSGIRITHPDTATPVPMSPAGGNVNALIDSMYGGSGPYGGTPQPQPPRPAAVNMGQGPINPQTPKAPPPSIASQFAAAPNVKAPNTPGINPAILQAGLSQSNPQQIPITLAHYLYGQ